MRVCVHLGQKSFAQKMSTGTNPPMPKKRGDRIADSELQTRVARVANLLLDGLTRRQIVGICGEEFKVSSGTVDRYIAQANAQIAEAHEGDIKAELAKSIDKLTRYQQSCIMNGDMKTAVDIEKQLNKLHGLDRQQVEVKHTADDPLVMLMTSIRERGKRVDETPEMHTRLPDMSKA
jgi:hypothetical protein